MMRRTGFVGIALLGTFIVLALADPAEAQRRGRRGRGMYYGPSYYPMYQQPGYQQPGYQDPAMAQGQDPRYSFYPMGMQRNSAQIQLRLPNPEAEVKFDGQTTRQKGMTRLFTTPPLDGTYSYQVTAAWQQDGQQITRERTIQVRPGASVMVDLTTDRGSNERPPTERPPTERPPTNP